MRLTIIAIACVSASVFAAPATAGVVGSSSLATLRQCDLVVSSDVCAGEGPGQQLERGAFKYGGGIGLAGWNSVIDGPNRAWSFVDFDAPLDLPTIRSLSRAVGNVRMNSTAVAFQSYTWTGTEGGEFSITGDLHIVDSSTSPDGGERPGGALYFSYVGIWDPSALDTLFTRIDLNQPTTADFFLNCDIAGVRGYGLSYGVLTGGEASYGATTSACNPGSLFLSPGQEVLVVVGVGLPVNRGGFADSSATLTTRLGDNLTPEQLTVAEQSIRSAISQGATFASVPEPGSWAMLIAGFGLTGATMRRRRTALA